MLYDFPNVNMYITCIICPWSVEEFNLEFFIKKFYLQYRRDKTESGKHVSIRR